MEEKQANQLKQTGLDHVTFDWVTWEDQQRITIVKEVQSLVAFLPFAIEVLNALVDP